MELYTDEGKLKQFMKEAVLEVLQDRKDVVYDIVAEVMEDMALARAIREGEDAETVSRATIFDILEGRP